MSDSTDPRYNSLSGLRPPDAVTGKTDDAAFPEEEQHRGKSRSGHTILPPPHFDQQATSSGESMLDSGTRITPEFKAFDHKSGDLKFSDPDLGFGQY